MKEIGDAKLHVSISEAKLIERDDPWSLPDIPQEDGPNWADLTKKEKCLHVLKVSSKLLSIPVCLYVFVCSLGLMSDSFRLIAGKAAGSVFRDVKILQNPVVGVMIGILVTILVQSSSTSTTIIVSLVAAQVLTVDKAIPMIMGSNVGTSVTNTIVSFTQIGDRNVFRRAFAAATIHDMFNWLTVLSLLPIEVLTGYLYQLSSAIVKAYNFHTDSGYELKLLKTITDPLLNRIIQLDKDVLKAWSLANINTTDETVAKFTNATSLLKKLCKFQNQTGPYMAPCDYLFANTSLSDLYVGLILLGVSLVCLCGCLMVIVKILNSLLKGQIASVIKNTINADMKYLPWLSGYLAMLVGCGMTILVQSSSIFTSALTPLAGLGVISLERIYPMTLGSNIGTTTTAILASLTASGESLRLSIQISLCHLFFNLTGILLFYVIPVTRLPIPLAKAMGNITSQYRWFAVVYVLVMFFVFPGLVLALSLAGPTVFLCVSIPIVVFVLIIVIINVMQRKVPSALPAVLRDWSCLPLWLHSLQPIDDLIMRCSCCRRQDKPAEGISECNGEDNKAFQARETQL